MKVCRTCCLKCIYLDKANIDIPLWVCNGGGGHETCELIEKRDRMFLSTELDSLVCDPNSRGCGQCDRYKKVRSKPFNPNLLAKEYIVDEIEI